MNNPKHILSTSKRRFISGVCVTVLIIISICSPISASVFYGYKISGGADNILYYIDGSALEYKDSINYGVMGWNNKSSNVSVARTTTKSYSRCDVYWQESFPYSPMTIAIILFYKNNQRVYPFQENWYWCSIHFNGTFYSYGNLTYNERKAEACHEYGHFLGLDDDLNSNISNVMCQWGYRDDSVISPSGGDIAGLRTLYGS